jgi:tetratricopeptide (TPR) repeat protein
VAVHRTIVVVDVEGFGDRRRTNADQLAVRAGMYRAVRDALARAGIGWEDCDHEDRGDGVFILAPAHLPKAVFVESLPGELVAAVRAHNAAHPVEARIRLRVALHAGEVVYDEHGKTAASIILAFRLLDAPPLKVALAESPGVLAMITSGWFFDEVVRHSRVTDPATFRRLRVAVKETSTTAWICLPDHPYLADPTPLLAADPVPRQLPVTPRSFTGRAAELAAIGAPAGIVAIGGSGGIGKTWLALHWAHRNIDRFPDGQLFVNLRGFDPTGLPMPAGTAIRVFLDALGVEPSRIPPDTDDQLALYRKLVAGKRILILLDNARDTEHVRPLLPASASCTVLVTSRHQLTGLVTTHDAQPLTLDVLTHTEAREVLIHRLGNDRVAAEPHAVAALLACCAGFPLALGVVAGRAALRPDLPLAMLANELRAEPSRLDALDTGDIHASLRAALSWSYHALDDAAARLFRLLGLATGPDIGLPAAAGLANLSTMDAHNLLQRLGRAHLIHQHQVGRYRMHDLIKLYAAEQARLDEAEHDVALRRLTDHYLHTADTGERLLGPYRTRLTFEPPTPGSRPRTLTPESTLDWFGAEHANLLAAQRTAAERDWPELVWLLAWVLTSFHYRQGLWDYEATVWRAATAATQRLADTPTRVLAHRRLGHALARLDHHQDALDHLHRALSEAEQTADLPGQAHTHRVLATAWERRGDDRRALDHARQALHLFQNQDNPIAAADALNLVGWYAIRLDQPDTARTHCTAALEEFRRHGNREGEAAALDSLGYLAHHTGAHTQAITHYRQALALYHQLDSPYDEPTLLERLGQAHAATGQHTEAHTAWHRAADLYLAQHRIDDADRIHQHLATQPPEHHMTSPP